MNSISVQAIQCDVTAFLRRVEAGESFLVVSGVQPLAEVRPVPAPTGAPRPFGLCAGQFTVPADFDHALPDEVRKEVVGA